METLTRRHKLRFVVGTWPKRLPNKLLTSSKFPLEPEDMRHLENCFQMVRSVSSIPGPDLLRLFDAVVFNYLIGNCDAHGKNFSFLRDGAAVRMALVYDLVSTQAYPDLSKQMAMKIGGGRLKDYW